MRHKRIKAKNGRLYDPFMRIIRFFRGLSARDEYFVVMIHQTADAHEDQFMAPW